MEIQKNSEDKKMLQEQAEKREENSQDKKTKEEIW